MRGKSHLNLSKRPLLPKDIQTDKQFLGQLKIDQKGFSKHRENHQTLLTYLETFGRWVPLLLWERRIIRINQKKISFYKPTTTLHLTAVRDNCDPQMLIQNSPLWKREGNLSLVNVPVVFAKVNSTLFFVPNVGNGI